jgi:hypothetical protein
MRDNRHSDHIFGQEQIKAGEKRTTIALAIPWNRLLRDRDFAGRK